AKQFRSETVLASLDGLSNITSDRRSTRHGFEASAVSAVAARPARLDNYVTYLPSVAGEAMMQRTVQDQPPADPCSDEYADDIAGASSRARFELAVHARVHVVLDDRATIELGRKARPDWEVGEPKVDGFDDVSGG